jgi:murein DD-endopeptidase MepM/ murein hydrolase activator NlpD
LLDYKIDKKKISLSKKARRMISVGTLILISIYLLFSILNSPSKDSTQPKSKIPSTQILPIQTTKKLPLITEIRGKIKPDQPLITVFTNNNLSSAQVLEMIKDIKPVYNLRYVRAGNKYKLVLKNNSFCSFVYYINENQFVTVKRSPTGYTGTIQKIPYKIKENIIKGEISSSLFETILKMNERGELADQLASLFEYDIDFNRDIRKGDSFSILVEKKYFEGVFKGYGQIKACHFINRGTKISIIRYTNPKGKTSYYHLDGRAVKKMFLRCPLPFMRVTSSYGIRKHPILKFSAKHNGIDLGAKSGTRIRTTASGTIFKAGYSRTKGRYIIIRHPNKYFTHYYHLSRIASGIRAGKRVIQSRIIGYVGSTGLSSGPHLHYGIRKNGRFINPLRFNSPSNPSVNKAFLKDFNIYKNKILALFSPLPTPQLELRQVQNLITQ